MRTLFSPRRTGSLWQALVLLLGLVLAGQSIAVQAHRHDLAHACAPGFAAVATADCHQKAANPHGKFHKDDGCALCQEARLSGHYLAIDAPLLAVVLRAAFLVAVVIAARQARLVPLIPWRSRAPPALRPIALPAF